MKPIGESAEVFAAYSRIDYRNFVIRKRTKELDSIFNSKEIKEIEKEIRSLLLEQIEDKKFIEADYQNELLLINNIDTL